MDSVKILLVLVLLSGSLTVHGKQPPDCSLVKCYYLIDCTQRVPAKGQCCPKCVNTGGGHCTYTESDGNEITIKNGKSEIVDGCNTCYCTDGVLACTQKACV